MNTKILFICLISSLLWNQSKSQEIITQKNLMPSPPYFLGGNIIIGASSHSFQLGINPELVKTYTPYLEAGVAMNIYYESYSAYELNPIKSNTFHYGVGSFVRAWPLNSLFAQIQPEYNWAWSSQKNTETGNSGNLRYGSPSLLAGIGYGKHGENGFSYVSIMFDLFNDFHSPYRDSYHRQEPVIRGGVGFPINFSKKKKP
jgi:hypothetical protein